MPPEILNILKDLSLSSGSYDRQQLETRLVQAVFEWTTKAGSPAVLEKESQVIRACQECKVSQQTIQAIRMAFANLRQLLQTIQQMSQMPVTTVWQQLTLAIRQMFASMAGGLQSVGQFIMRQGQMAAGGIAAAWALVRAAAGVALAAVFDAIEAAVAMIGGWPVVLGIFALIALGLAANWLYERNRTPFPEDPLIKRLNSSAPYVPPFRFQPGRVG